jgi:hypothetical protein
MASPDLDITNAPDYVKQFVARPTPNSVAELLADGSWCGHGEELCRVYDVVENGNSVFQIQLPDTKSEDSFPPAVKVTSVPNQKQFLVYDTRQHPASWHAFGDNAKKESKFSDKHFCNKCNGINFKISIGFEVPVDSDVSNDTSWFALATECIKCGDRTITFDDETA